MADFSIFMNGSDKRSHEQNSKRAKYCHMITDVIFKESGQWEILGSTENFKLTGKVTSFCVDGDYLCG